MPFLRSVKDADLNNSLLRVNLDSSYILRMVKKTP